MACIFSSPTVNGDAGAGLLSASVNYSNDWCAASVEDIFGTGKLWVKSSTVLIIFSAHVTRT